MNISEDSMFSLKNQEKLFGAVTLIVFGVVLLLNSTGLVGWGVWVAFLVVVIKFWPIFLIFAGLQIIFNKSFVAKTILNIVWTIGSILLLIFSILVYSNMINVPKDFADWKSLENTIQENINKNKEK